MTTTQTALVARITQTLHLADDLICDAASELGFSTWKVRRALDDVHRALDDALIENYPEDVDPALCTRCHQYWPPAGRTVCARCEPLPVYQPRAISEAERVQDDLTLRAIQSVGQTIPLDLNIEVKEFGLTIPLGTIIEPKE